MAQAIGEAKSKQEEDRIIMEEMATLKQKMPTQVRITAGSRKVAARAAAVFLHSALIFLAHDPGNIHKEDEGIPCAAHILRDARP
eukprot:30972-Eustigmatos_ZCMA.PRE.1